MIPGTPGPPFPASPGHLSPSLPLLGNPAWARPSAAALGFVIPQRKGREQQREREKEIGNQGSGPSAQPCSAGGGTRTRRKNWLRSSRCLPGFGPSPAGSGQSLSAGPGVQHSPARGSRRARPWRVPDGSPRDPERGQEGIQVNSLEFALFPFPFSPPPALLGHFRFRVSPAAPQPRSGTAAMAPALGLGVLWGLLGLLENPGGATKVLHSLHYLHVAVSEPSPGIPQYMSMGYLDGIPFTRYDSEQGRVEPRTQWIKDGVDPEYWERETQINEGNQHMALQNLEIRQERYNQSGGLHTVQWLSGCELLSDGSVRGSYQNGYDGRDYIFFDLESGRFVAADSAAEITRRRWEQEEVAEGWTNYLKYKCPEWLRKYVGYGQKELERKEPPDVHVSGREEHGTLILSCYAYGFYPNTIAVSWMKGGETLDQETEWGGIVPNSDGTFHTWARIEALPEEREQYRCRVEHPGMPEPGIFAWEPTSGGNLTVVVAVSVIAAILILIVLIGFGIWKLQSGRRDRNGYNPAAGRDMGTNSSSTGIAA